GCRRIWLGEDRAHARGYQLLRTLRYQRRRIAHEMGSAALPARALEYRRDRSLQALVRIARHEFDAVQSTRYQAPKEGMPEGTILAGSHVEPEQLPLAVMIADDSDHHRQASDAV